MRLKTFLCSFLIFGISLHWLNIFAQYNPFEAKKEVPKYKYIDIDANFAKELEKFRRDRKPEVLEEMLEQKQKEQAKAEGVSKAEKWIHIAILLEEKSWYVSSALIYMQVAEDNKGTKQSEYALYKLSQLLLDKYPFDSQILELFFRENRFAGLHPEVAAMVAYYTGHAYIDFGFDPWTLSEKKQIEGEPKWFFRLKWREHLYEILNQAEEFPFAKLKDFYLANEKTLGQVDTNEIYLQSARFLFEQAEFERAFQLYKSFDFVSGRLRGKILLEMAWAKFYSQDYSHAMGLLQLLKAPLFEISQVPERYILEALLLKQLCYYDEVKEVEAEYVKSFEQSFSASKQRVYKEYPLQMVNAVLLSGKLSDLATNYEDSKRELAEFSKKPKLWEMPISKLTKLSKYLENRLQAEVEIRRPDFFSELLKVKKELNYLSYVSGLDKMRGASDKKEYKSEKVEKFKFDRLVWKSSGEFWLDEMDDFRVLLDSRCGKEDE